MKNNPLTMLLALCVFPAILHAQAVPAARIDSLLTKANRLGMFNGNVLVALNDRVILKKSYGFADTSRRVLLNEHYRFHIGSIAKEFNAVAIMMLAEQGKLKLGDKVSKYLPELPAWASTVSVLNLMQYTSGIPDVKWKTVKNDVDNMADIMKIDTLNFAPGTNYNYNNNNVFLQRRIVERLSGMSFNEFVRVNLLKPAGMLHSVIDPVDGDSLIARAYNNAGAEDPLAVPIAGWTAVTSEDFYRWALSVREFKLISAASTRQILYPVGPNKQAGLGGGSMNGDRMARHEHDGTARNYQALLIDNAAGKTTVLLMTNNMQNNLYPINNSISLILGGKPAPEIRRSLLTDKRAMFDTMTGKEVLAYVEQLKKGASADYSFDSETTLNAVGYFFKNKGQLDDAILIFEYNTQLFPTSGNVFDSLGESYYARNDQAKDDKAKALLNYKIAYRLDPSNESAKMVIAELEK